MKKSLVLLLFLCFVLSGCGGSPSVTEAVTDVPLPPAGTLDYGEEWANADLYEQISADDKDFALTGKGFEYRDGYMGLQQEGYFDLCCTYEPGSEEDFCFEFRFYASGGGKVYAGIWLPGSDCRPGDGTFGYWFECTEKYIRYGGKTVAEFDTETTDVMIKTDIYSKNVFLYVNGELQMTEKYETNNGGGAVKLYSDTPAVYIRNTAFRLGADDPDGAK